MVVVGLGQAIINGLSNGAVYALIALGFVMIFKATGVLNFAQGEAVMMGGYIGIALHMLMGFNYWIAFLVTLILSFLTGIIIEQVAYKPLIHAPLFTLILATIAVGQILRCAARLIFSDRMVLFTPIFSTKAILFAGIHTTPLYLGIIGISVVFVILTASFFKFTQIGKAMQAASQNRIGATLVGINVARMYTLIWGLSFMLASAGGYLLAPVLIITPEVGFIAFKAFVAAVLGGFTSIPGAIYGGVLLALIESMSGIYIGTASKDIITFVVFLLVIVIKPTGLLGKKEVIKV